MSSPAAVVHEFVTRVRSGLEPEAAHRLMAAEVAAHQVVSGPPQTVRRTPANYAEHVREFLRDYGPFDFAVEELLASGDKVYVRWRQSGHHLQPILSFPPTGRPLISVGSAVYRVVDGRITEYWIQQENFGLLEQLRSQQSAP
jgi:predicted ester cyclase